MNRKEKYPMLRCLFAAYFNQDWQCDYDNPEAVIKSFAHAGNKNDIQQTIIELKILLNEVHTFQEWEDILYEDFGCEYYFDYEEEYTPKEFLEKVLKQFEEELTFAKDE